ncbi:MAG: SIS domain-containing protein [Clostridia bacterium]|nr:SIS domain-containing protein [Clostridia bacterium]
MIHELICRYPALTVCQADILATIDTIIACYERGGKVLLCGNGGSCADSDHIVGELMKGFLKKRPLSDAQKAAMKAASPTLTDERLDALQAGLPAISLPSLTALNTAFCNDADPELIYAQAVLALSRPGDVLIAISTSGNAKNVFAAVQVAKGLGVTVIGLTGNTGGKLKQYADIAVCVPETETFKIQELHLPVYHTVCAAVEAHFFPV